MLFSRNEFLFPKKKRLKFRPTAEFVPAECNAVYRLTHCCGVVPAYWLATVCLRSPNTFFLCTSWFKFVLDELQTKEMLE